ncbi:unnamed protein product [Trichogramma brassicae]|uniref:C2H2-type domain-containing protein n=1 Tax=Trichogramma brassicae TaxID=86971 RepID=A0A6H5IAS4_9HYME|nr:unnamed protein product [Trichogramma brassicae]
MGLLEAGLVYQQDWPTSTNVQQKPLRTKIDLSDLNNPGIQLTGRKHYESNQRSGCSLGGSSSSRNPLMSDDLSFVDFPHDLRREHERFGDNLPRIGSAAAPTIVHIHIHTHTHTHEVSEVMIVDDDDDDDTIGRGSKLIKQRAAPDDSSNFYINDANATTRATCSGVQRCSPFSYLYPTRSVFIRITHVKACTANHISQHFKGIPHRIESDRKGERIARSRLCGVGANTGASWPARGGRALGSSAVYTCIHFADAKPSTMCAVCAIDARAARHGRRGELSSLRARIYRRKHKSSPRITRDGRVGYEALSSVHYMYAYFVVPVSIRLRQKTAHEGRKDYACNKCEKKFTRKLNWLNHQRKIHEGRKDYGCDRCEKKFGFPSNLLLHQKTVHEGCKDHACGKCEKKFSDTSNLIRHQKAIHEGQKDFTCDECEKKFTQKRSPRERFDETTTSDVDDDKKYFLSAPPLERPLSGTEEKICGPRSFVTSITRTHPREIKAPPVATTESSTDIIPLTPAPHKLNTQRDLFYDPIACAAQPPINELYYIHSSVVGGFCENGQGTPEDLLFFYSHLDNKGEVLRTDEVVLNYTYHPEATTFSIKQAEKRWCPRASTADERADSHRKPPAHDSPNV